MSRLSSLKRLVPDRAKRALRELLPELFPKKDLLVGMTTGDEQRWYCSVAAEVVNGGNKGAIVDLGSWMGSTAISLAKGIKKALPPGAPAPPVYAIDRYIWEPWMQAFASSATGISCDYLDGDSFLPEVRRRLAASQGNILAVEADLISYKWQGGDIAILLVDAMKTPELCMSISREFYPHLRPGSVLIHQDYKHYFTCWIHLLQYRLREYFDFIHDVPNSGTVGFSVKKSVPPEIIEAAAQITKTTDQEMLKAITYSIEMVDNTGKGNIAAAHAMHFVHGDRNEEAASLLEQYAAKYGHNDDLLGVKEILSKASQR
jgi:hypothetical protein